MYNLTVTQSHIKPKWIDTAIKLGTSDSTEVQTIKISAIGRSDDFMQQASIAAWSMVIQDYSLLLRNDSGQPNLATNCCSRNHSS